MLGEISCPDHYINKLITSVEVASGPCFALVSHGGLSGACSADEWKGGGP